MDQNYTFVVSNYLSSKEKVTRSVVPLTSQPPEGTLILGHTMDVRPEWASFQGPKTCEWV